MSHHRAVPKPLRRSALAAALAAAPATRAAEPPEAPGELDFYAPLPVVLVSTRLQQPQRDAPVAVTVIDRDTIRASGAQDIPALMRLVPGMALGRVSGSRTTLALHGFTDQFQRTMQVLVDGRSVYDPGFGGVMWEDLPVALEDVERIEVMRDPASSLYGANAFAATINIITAHPRDQQGVALTATAGEQGLGRGFARYGGSTGDLDYRVSLVRRDSDGLPGRHDSSRTWAASLRADYRLGAQDLLLAESRLQRHSPAQRVRTFLQFQDETRERLERAMRQYLSQHQLQLQNQIARLESVSPMAVLRRGFAIVSDSKTHQLISRRDQTNPNQLIEIQLSDGKIAATISGDTP